MSNDTFIYLEKYLNRTVDIGVSASYISC